MRIKKEIQESFEYSMARARALLALQEGVEMLISFIEVGDLFEYVKKQYPDISEFTEQLRDTLFQPIQSKLSELNDECEADIENFVKLQEAAQKIEPETIERAFQPLIRVMDSMIMIHQDPLYHEAIVSSVSAFETYIKDSIIYLVSSNKKVEARFTDILCKKVNYDKIKQYDYDWEQLTGYIVTENIDFHDMNSVEKTYRAILGKNKDSGLKIFGPASHKKKIQNFIKLRHLIVHNCGIVDHKFKKETGCKEKVGEVYPITREYVDAMISSIALTVDVIELEIRNAR